MRISELVQERCANSPDETAAEWLIFAGGDGVPARRDSWTWGDLGQRAAGLAREITRGAGTRPPAQPPIVALLLPTSPEYWVAFMGCALAGAIAVPLDRVDPHRPVDRLAAILATCRPDIIVIHEQDRGPTQAALARVPGLGRTALLAVDTLMRRGDPAEFPVRATTAPDSLACLQFTSGSYMHPSGAKVTSEAFCSHMLQATADVAIPPGARTVSWLPMSHNMGLFLSLGISLVLGVPCTMMSPQDFLMNPARWLVELGTGQFPTYSGAPNFALDHCIDFLRKYAGHGLPEREAGTFDLGLVQSIYCGSETIRPESVRTFQACLEPYGLRPQTIRPSYGMAEAIVYVSSRQGMTVASCDREALRAGRAEPAQDDDRRQEIVSCGPPAPGLEAVCVDPETLHPVGERAVGELWLRGPNIVPGYWNEPDHDRETFGWVLADDETGRQWLRSGDLAFFDDGEIYLVGRLKAMVVANGQNHYAEDVERTVQRCDPRVRPGRVAVVADPTASTEAAVVLAECRGLEGDDRVALGRRITECVALTHGLTVNAVHLLEPNTLPLTPSGKVQRGFAAEIVRRRATRA